jgi:hypothetical protein
MAFFKPLIDSRQPLTASKPFPFTDERCHFPAHRQQTERRFRAVLVLSYLAPDGVLPLKHVSSQAADFTSSFVDTIVHGSLRITEGQHKNKT